jgi:hypothetical protein
MSNKIKHLEFIQGVINRHNSNSFMIKGWSITLTTAIFAFTGSIKEPILCFISLGPIIMFWILDSIFLANERCFISMYECVVNNKLIVEKEKLKKNSTTESSKEFLILDLSMNFKQFKEIKRNNWYSVFLSNTISWFYSILVLLTLIIYLGLSEYNKKEELKPLNINATIQNSESLKIEPINVNITSKDTIKINQVKLKVNSKKMKKITK